MRVIIIVVGVFCFVVIIDTNNRAGKGSGLAEGNEDSLVYLALRSEQCSKVEQSDASDSQRGGDDKLYAIIHMRFCLTVQR